LQVFERIPIINPPCKVCLNLYIDIKVADDEEGKRALLQIALADHKKKIFNFTEGEYKNARDNVKSIIESIQKDQKSNISESICHPIRNSLEGMIRDGINKLEIDDQYHERIKILKKYPHLLELHQQLVQNSILTEEEFWKTHPDFSLLEKEKKETEQKAGVHNLAHAVYGQNNANQGSLQIDLKKEEAQRLLQ
jgi:hypothetical protein